MATNKIKFLWILLSLGTSSILAQQSDSVQITFQTKFGDIQAVLYTGKAPVTTANFLKYIDQFGQNGGEFYRTVTLNNQPGNKVKIEVIQGGFSLGISDSVFFKPIPMERTNVSGILHKNGTLSMARDDPDSGTSEFFICINDQPSLDFGGERNPDGQGFAAFGRVIKGMDIIRKIQTSSAKDQSLDPTIKILKISRL
jgi:peptidyl-prolyl cis-trans isomerase A (cyclophilin A)